jgi:hypothetical protein
MQQAQVQHRRATLLCPRSAVTRRGVLAMDSVSPIAAMSRTARRSMGARGKSGMTLQQGLATELSLDANLAASSMPVRTLRFAFSMTWTQRNAFSWTVNHRFQMVGPGLSSARASRQMPALLRSESAAAGAHGGIQRARARTPATRRAQAAWVRSRCRSQPVGGFRRTPSTTAEERCLRMRDLALRI